MKYCETCGCQYDDDNMFCENCGSQLVRIEDVQSGHETKKKFSWVWLLVVVLVLLLLGLGAWYFFGQGKDEQIIEETTISSVVTEKRELSKEESEAESGEEVESADLYLPDDYMATTPTEVFVYCIDTEVQDFVKMRCGPSKSDYDVAGVMDNFSRATVLSEDYDGWTLVSREDGKKGWVRSDFIFTYLNNANRVTAERIGKYYSALGSPGRLVRCGFSQANKMAQADPKNEIWLLISEDSQYSLYAANDVLVNQNGQLETRTNVPVLEKTFSSLTQADEYLSNKPGDAYYSTDLTNLMK